MFESLRVCAAQCQGGVVCFLLLTCLSLYVFALLGVKGGSVGGGGCVCLFGFVWLFWFLCFLLFLVFWVLLGAREGRASTKGAPPPKGHPPKGAPPKGAPPKRAPPKAASGRGRGGKLLLFGGLTLPGGANLLCPLKHMNAAPWWDHLPMSTEFGEHPLSTPITWGGGGPFSIITSPVLSSKFANKHTSPMQMHWPLQLTPLQTCKFTHRTMLALNQASLQAIEIYESGNMRRREYEHI